MFLGEVALVDGHRLAVGAVGADDVFLLLSQEDHLPADHHPIIGVLLHGEDRRPREGSDNFECVLVVDPYQYEMAVGGDSSMAATLVRVAEL